MSSSEEGKEQEGRETWQHEFEQAISFEDDNVFYPGPESEGELPGTARSESKSPSPVRHVTAQSRLSATATEFTPAMTCGGFPGEIGASFGAGSFPGPPPPLRAFTMPAGGTVLIAYPEAADPRPPIPTSMGFHHPPQSQVTRFEGLLRELDLGDSRVALQFPQSINSGETLGRSVSLHSLSNLVSGDLEPANPRPPSPTSRGPPPTAATPSQSQVPQTATTELSRLRLVKRPPRPSPRAPWADASIVSSPQSINPGETVGHPVSPLSLPDPASLPLGSVEHFPPLASSAAEAHHTPTTEP